MPSRSGETPPLWWGKIQNSFFYVIARRTSVRRGNLYLREWCSDNSEKGRLESRNIIFDGGWGWRTQCATPSKIQALSLKLNTSLNSLFEQLTGVIHKDFVSLAREGIHLQSITNCGRKNLIFRQLHPHRNRVDVIL